MLDVAGDILLSLSLVGKRSWSSLYKKLVSSEPSPEILHLLHVTSQSVFGYSTSTLQGMYSMEFPTTLMVTFSSSNTRYHSFKDIFRIFSGVSCDTLTRILKKEAG